MGKTVNLALALALLVTGCRNRQPTTPTIVSATNTPNPTAATAPTATLAEMPSILTTAPTATVTPETPVKVYVDYNPTEFASIRLVNVDDPSGRKRGLISFFYGGCITDETVSINQVIGGYELYEGVFLTYNKGVYRIKTNSGEKPEEYDVFTDIGGPPKSKRELMIMMTYGPLASTRNFCVVY